MLPGDRWRGMRNPESAGVGATDSKWMHQWVPPFARSYTVIPPRRAKSQVAGAELAGLLPEENRAVIEMLVQGDPIMQILPPRIGCGHGKTPRTLDFREAVQRPLQVLHCAWVNATMPLRRSGLDAPSRFMCERGVFIVSLFPGSPCFPRTSLSGSNEAAASLSPKVSVPWV